MKDKRVKGFYKVLKKNDFNTIKVETPKGFRMIRLADPHPVRGFKIRSMWDTVLYADQFLCYPDHI